MAETRTALYSWSDLCRLADEGAPEVIADYEFSNGRVFSHDEHQLVGAYEPQELGE